jgi:hypothetical protein
LASTPAAPPPRNHSWLFLLAEDIIENERKSVKSSQVKSAGKEMDPVQGR